MLNKSLLQCISDITCIHPGSLSSAVVALSGIVIAVLVKRRRNGKFSTAALNNPSYEDTASELRYYYYTHTHTHTHSWTHYVHVCD